MNISSLLALFLTFCFVSFFTMMTFIKNKPKDMDYANGLIFGSWLSLCALLANFVFYMLNN